MNWSDEPFVKVYTRDTGDLLAVGWEGRALWWEMIRKADRAGVLSDAADPVVLAELVRMPVEVVKPALEKIQRREMVRVADNDLVIENFMAAQEARKSDRQRQAESRARRRALSIAVSRGVVDAPEIVTPCDAGQSHARGDEQAPGAVVTPSRHTVSHGVTAGHTESHLVTLRIDQTRIDQTRESSDARAHVGRLPVGEPGDPCGATTAADARQAAQERRGGPNETGGGPRSPNPEIHAPGADHSAPQRVCAQGPPADSWQLATGLIARLNAHRARISPGHPPVPAPATGAPTDRVRALLAQFELAELERAVDNLAVEAEERAQSGEDPLFWLSAKSFSDAVIVEAMATTPEAIRARFAAQRKPAKKRAKGQWSEAAARAHDRRVMAEMDGEGK